MFLSQTSAMREARLAALDRAQGVIEFDLAGTILDANPNFLAAVGYTREEVVGRHHGLFVDPDHRNSAEYRAFWDRLREGRSEAGQFRRVAKSGDAIWIEASYNPLLGRDGKPRRIVKFATDITRRTAEDAERAGQISAIAKSQGVVAFALDGTILDANEAFLSVVGYRLDEIRGRHHGMFVEPGYRAGPDYAAFWEALRGGVYQAAQYKRIAKGGGEVWIQASYNPILDAVGRPYKVVKFATDITEQVKLLCDLRVLIDRNFGEIDRALDRSTEESRTALEAARSTSGSVGTMAAATEELAASVAEMSQSMAKSQAATENAFERVREAGDRTRRLADAAHAMSGIVGLITTIAAQINLLALNATIEAARAGEAGRGFAVVAQEVKSLAGQAARATEQINGEIQGVQAISTEVVGALDSIRGSVDVMRDHVVATAAAVEEQSAVTRDMSVNMQDAARAVATIADTITAISSGVTQVSDAVTATREAARVLAR